MRRAKRKDAVGYLVAYTAIIAEIAAATATCDAEGVVEAMDFVGELDRLLTGPENKMVEIAGRIFYPPQLREDGRWR